MITNIDWMADAACLPPHDPELFHPKPNDTAEKAKAICDTCPVIKPCLNYAITNRIAHGVWGGVAGRARIKMWRRG